jgi:hypothetical protein
LLVPFRIAVLVLGEVLDAGVELAEAGTRETQAAIGCSRHNSKDRPSAVGRKLQDVGCHVASEALASHSGKAKQSRFQSGAVHPKPIRLAGHFTPRTYTLAMVGGLLFCQTKDSQRFWNLSGLRVSH